MENILEYIEKYKNTLETLQCPEVLRALQRPDVQRALDDPGVRLQFFATYECLIEQRNKSKSSQERLECERQMQTTLEHLTEPNNQTTRYNCDDVMDNISFWEELLNVVEEIEGMSKREREKCLFRVIKRDMSEGPHWQRQILKILLVDPLRRDNLKEAIKSGRIYDSMSLEGLR